jgi:hypothetical protein
MNWYPLLRALWALPSNVGSASLPASNFQIDRFWTNALVAARHANCFAFNYQANFIEIAEDFVFYVQKFSPFINICCACGNKKADKLGLGNKSE